MGDGAKNKKSINKVLMNKTPMNRTMIVGLIILIVIIIIAIIMVIVSIRILSRREEHIEVIIEEKILLNAIKSRPSHSINQKHQRIPRIIMQTNEKHQIPQAMFDSITTILDNNPEYNYFYFDDEDADNFMKENYGSRLVRAYHDLIPGAFKADLFRYCFLYKYGGIYIDTGMVCLRPLRELIKESDEFIAPQDDKSKKNIYNAFICCIPAHPIIGAAIRLCLKNIENRDKCEEMLAVTGPGVLGQSFTAITQQSPLSGTKINNFSNIKIIRHLSGKTLHGDGSIVGEIDLNGKVFLKTKYPTYYKDRTWYHTKEHYGVLWKRNEIYHSIMKGEKRDNEFCPLKTIRASESIKLVNTITNRSPLISCDKKQKIPKIIAQTNERDEVPERMFNAMQTILEKNPEYQYYYFNAVERRKFISNHYSSEVLLAYDRLVPGAFKADLFRYCFLYKYGGVYIDSGMTCKIPLRDLIGEKDKLIVPEDNGQLRLYNAFMCAVPNHYIFKIAIDRIIDNVNNRYYGESALHITSPGLLGEIFEELYGEKMQPHRYYSGNLKSLRYTSYRSLYDDPCLVSGMIDDEKGSIFFETKYLEYAADMQRYHKLEQYDVLWQCRQAYDLTKY